MDAPPREETGPAREGAFVRPTLWAALEASLVLEALGIPHELRSLRATAPREVSVPQAPAAGEAREGGGPPDAREERREPAAREGDPWAVFVAEADHERAATALAEYALEGEAPALPPPAPDYGESAVGPIVALITIAFSTFVGPRDLSTPWFLHGSAEAAHIVSGEWWRAITALTLHADAGHAGGNAVALGFLLSALARRLGTGLAAWLPLCAGVAGNWLTAEAMRGSYDSVGASTAVFGALGILSAMQAPGRRAWLTLGAGVALLGFLGTGARADLIAHLFGFLCGALQGLLLRRRKPPPRSRAQPLVASLALVPIVAAWVRALAGTS